MSYNTTLVNVTGGPFMSVTSFTGESSGLSYNNANSLFLNVGGDTMHGNINMNEHNITNISNPKTSKDTKLFFTYLY